MIDNVPDVTISLKWAGILLSAITVVDGLLIWALLWLEKMVFTLLIQL